MSRTNQKATRKTKEMMSNYHEIPYSRPRPKAPFTKNEQEAWLALAKAWGHFVQLEQTHISHVKDFTDAIHKCQDILGHRVLQRQYPGSYAAYDRNGNMISDESMDRIRKEAEENSLLDTDRPT